MTEDERQNRPTADSAPVMFPSLVSRLAGRFPVAWVAVVGPLIAIRAAGNDGEDWPQFLGPRANNISAETGLLAKWPTNGPPLLIFSTQQFWFMDFP